MSGTHLSISCKRLLPSEQREWRAHIQTAGFLVHRHHRLRHDESRKLLAHEATISHVMQPCNVTRSAMSHIYGMSVYMGAYVRICPISMVALMGASIDRHMLSSEHIDRSCVLAAQTHYTDDTSAH